LDPKLIILYGDVGPTPWKKAQNLIDGQMTCGYREYARRFGCIVYMNPQRVYQEWESCITTAKGVIHFVEQYPEAVVWAVKHAPTRDETILKHIPNRKLYYSCCNQNMYNAYCDVSLVDSAKRLKKNAKLFFKGKDEEFWHPTGAKKVYDYLLIGLRGDKNEAFFLNKLNQVKGKRTILWIGGGEAKKKIRTKHSVVMTPRIRPSEVRDLISTAKVGVIFTELGEGFPQSFLEMTICGVPVVYHEKAPRNDIYCRPENSVLANRTNLVEKAEELLGDYNAERCREVAIEHYSLKKSFEHLRSL